MEDVTHPDRTMVTLSCRRCPKASFHSIPIPERTIYFISIFPLKRRHKPHSVNTLAIIEAVHTFMFAGPCKFSFYLIIREGIAIRPPLQGNLENAPLFNLICHCNARTHETPPELCKLFYKSTLYLRINPATISPRLPYLPRNTAGKSNRPP